MKASELRIGNLVKSIGIEYVVCKVDNHGNIKGVEGNTSFNLDRTTEPIPLTEEWLLKFGFEKAYETCYQYKDFILNDKFIMMDIDITIQLKHVHQLQNLYFALTGEEL